MSRTLLPCLSTLAAVVLVAGAAAAPTAPPKPKTAVPALRTIEAQLRFEANRGQTDARAAFLARSQGSVVFLTRQGTVIKTAHGAMSVDFAGASSAARPEAMGTAGTPAHYFLARGRAVTAPTYARVAEAGIYPGVDAVYYGRQGQLEYDLNLAPGASLAQVQLAIAGVQPQINAAGDLVLSSAIRFRAPQAYQEVNGQRHAVAVHYVAESNGRIGFSALTYDHGRALVVDPVLQYSSLLGGSLFNQVNGVALDSNGEAFVTGYTLSSDFPTVGPFQGTLHAGNNDAFVTKFAAAGASIVYSTYVGGSGDDQATAIAVDAAGDAYVTGFTTSADFPVTSGAYNTTAPTDGNYHGFVTVLNPAGAAEIYSTYIYGNGTDKPAAIAVDGAGDAFITGTTNSSNFPVSAGAPQTTLGGTTNAFITAVNSAGSGLLYSTYFGGSASDRGQAIAVDATGNAYVGGAASSSNIPVTAGALQTSLAGGFDGFVVKVDRSGKSFDYATYVGGKKSDEVNAIAVDSAGHAFIAGDTASIDIFANQSSVAQPNFGGGNSDGFAAELNSGGSALAYGTYIGGSGTDVATGIVVDGTDDAYITGFTGSVSDFPITSNAVQPANGGVQDAFLVKLDALGQTRLYSSYYGGLQNDGATAIAIDKGAEIAIAGNTSSANFPTTKGAAQTTITSQNLGFVAKFQPAPQGVFSPSAVGFAAQAPTVASAAQSATFTNGGELPLTISSITTTGPYTETDTCTGSGAGTLQPGASCSISIVFTPTAVGAQNGSLVVNDNAPGGSQTLQLSGAGGDFSVSVTPTTLTITAGSSASFGFNVTPANGYTQVVTLTCAGIDATEDATCTPSPTTLTMNGSTTSTATFTIDTTARPSTTLVPALPTLPPGPWTWLALLALALAGAGVVYSLRSRRRAGWIGAAVLLGWAIAAVGCGGSTASNGTAAANYTLTFTGTAGSSTHNTTVQLTVN